MVFSVLMEIFQDTVSVIHSPLEVKCTVSLCGGDLAPVYCHGDIVSTAWRFGLQDVCPGTRMRFNAEQILKNFQKSGFLFVCFSDVLA